MQVFEDCLSEDYREEITFSNKTAHFIQLRFLLRENGGYKKVLKTKKILKQLKLHPKVKQNI